METEGGEVRRVEREGLLSQDAGPHQRPDEGPGVAQGPEGRPGRWGAPGGTSLRGPGQEAI